MPLELPLVIAVKIMDDFCDDIDVLNALFGEEQGSPRVMHEFNRMSSKIRGGKVGG